MYHELAESPFCRRALFVMSATRTIVRAIVLELARGGAQGTFNHAQSAVATETLKAGSEALGVRIIGVQGEAADTDAAYEIIKQVKEAFGRFDLFIHNTIITRDNLTLCMKGEDWDAVGDTNLKRTWNFLSDFACVK